MVYYCLRQCFAQGDDGSFTVKPVVFPKSL